MILKKMTLHNVGLYAGTNTFDFDTDKPVILIGGMNGHGKTTFLEAILLALYGRRSFAFSESKLSYQPYLRKFTNVADGTQQSYIELSFDVGHTDEKDAFVLRRAWSVQQKGVEETISVFKNDAEDIFLSDNWAMYIEELLPSAISSFFFFDGEKISELAAEASGEQMRDSIKMLLGIDVLDRLEADLKKILSNKDKELPTFSGHQQMQVLREQEGELDEHLTVLQRDIAGIQADMEACQREIDVLEAQFMARGGVIGENRLELFARKHKLEDERSELNHRILSHASAELPLMLVEPLLHTIYETAFKEQSEWHERLAVSRIKQLFSDFKQHTRTATQEVEMFISFIESAARGDADSTNSQYHLSESALAQAKLLSRSFLPDIRRDTERLQARRLKIKNELDEMENYLLVDIDKESIDAIYPKIKKLSAKIGADTERKHLLEKEQSECSARLVQVQRELAKLVERSLSELESMDESARIVQYANQALKLLSIYRLRLQEQKATTLAQTMTACYMKIAHKKNLIAHVEIDAETLDFIYLNLDGNEVNKKSLSAGEKQLMVVAMLWALAICSHNKFPVIIDTPLARLDSAHRERMVKAYFPEAGRQTIILSTDSEIDNHYYSLLKPSIGKAFTLTYDEKEKRTTIADGYFGG